MSPPVSRAEACYARLLRCYPGGFRASFEDGMRHAFRQEHAEARARGRRALVRFWLVTVSQAVVFGLAERRRSRRGSRMSMSLLDWRDAFRSLRTTPVITGVAVLSLALGTGANTALFSILNSLLYKPLPVREPSRLVLLGAGSWTNPIWEQMRDRQSQFSAGAFAWSPARLDLSDHGESDFVPGAFVSGGMFDVLGVPAALGRTLTVDDDRQGSPAGPVAVLGYDFWQERFGGAPDVVGRTLTIQRAKFTVVGVMGAGFHGPEVGSSVAVALPLATQAWVTGSMKQLEGRSTWWLYIMARLKPGQSIDAATAQLNAIRPAIRAATEPPNWRPQDLEHYLQDPWVLQPAATGTSELRGTYRDPLTVILAIVGVVLVIACANIANILIARATARRHELCVRLALGATRWRLARQLLLESLILAGAGAALGLLFAQWGSRLVVSQISAGTFLDLSPDWRVLGFTAGVAVVTAVLFGVAPSLAVTRVTPEDALRERGRAVTDTRAGLRHALVVAQVALSLTLLIGAGLFVRTFTSLAGRPLGFDVDPVIDVTVRTKRGDAAAAPRLFEQARQAAAAVPGVESAALSFTTPIGNATWNTLITQPGQSNVPERERSPWVNLVTPGWFATYGMRLVAGRDFSGADVEGAPDVTVITRSFAAKYFPGVNPVGRDVLEETFGTKPALKPYLVIGVVEDAAYRNIREEFPPTMYRALAQAGTEGPQGSVELSVRAAAGSAEALVKPVVAAVAAVDPSIRLTARPLSEQLRGAVRQERLVAILSGFFGGLATLLAGLGLYGVTSYTVGRRRAEIGIRMALGAEPGRIVGMVLRQAGTLVVAGIVIGAGLSVWSVRYVRALLYGVDGSDPLMLAGGAFVLLAIGLAAAWLPASRASRIDPTVTLRTD